MFLFFFLEFHQFLLQGVFQILDELLVVFLDFGDFDFRPLEHVIFYLIPVTLHRQLVPFLQTSFQSARMYVLLRPFLHLPEVLILVSLLLPSIEKCFFVIFGVEKSGEVLNLVPFLLNLRGLAFTFLLRMQ